MLDSDPDQVVPDSWVSVYSYDREFGLERRKLYTQIGTDRSGSFEALLPVGPDPRRPMREIYEMFSGRMTPQDVLSAAGGQPLARFYAHLYRGLYHEAFGRTEAATEEIFLAADDQFAQVGGYMHMVAVVHRDLLGR